MSPVDGAFDDLGAAQVGQIEVGLERGIAEHVDDFGAARRELVFGLEAHGASLPHPVYCAAFMKAQIRRPGPLTRSRTGGRGPEVAAA